MAKYAFQTVRPNMDRHVLFPGGEQQGECYKVISQFLIKAFYKWFINYNTKSYGGETSNYLKEVGVNLFSYEFCNDECHVDNGTLSNRNAYPTVKGK